MHLPVGTLLQGGRYEIIRYISRGGFGITYEARDTKFKGRMKSLAVKEFFVKDFCSRDSGSNNIIVATQSKVELVERLRVKFMEEADAIFELEHPNIVRVTDTFEENGTAYYVMEYINGTSLAALVAKVGPLSETQALGYIRQVADALEYVHSLNRLHLDVTPANIMIDNYGKAILIDFGVSKQYDEVNGENTSTVMGYAPGYAPIEQCGGGIMEFHAATDIYALAATLYKLLTGITPMPANQRASSAKLLELTFPDGISPAVRTAIETSMRLHVENRPQSIGEFLALLENGNVKTENGKEEDDGATLVAFDNSSSTPVVEEAEPTIPPVIPTKRSAEESQSANKEKPTDPVIPPKKPSGKKWFIIAAVAIIAVVAVILGINSGGGEAPDENVIVFNVNDVEFKMVAVGGGTFKMGATSEQQNPYDDEKPVHNVTLSSYYIGETEVTQALWEAVMGSNPSHFSGNSNPVEQVSYNDCITFIDKLNSLLSGQLPSGRKFRLPTEAEWEFAARGGNSSRGYRYSGSDNLGSVAWYADNSGSKTHPVKQKQPNELGLYDMSGNVCEWCYDWFGSYSSSSQTNPKGPSSGSLRVFRGGSWNYYAQLCRVANRFNFTPDIRFNYYGLRLVL